MRHLIVLFLSLIIAQVCANTSQIGWVRLVENQMNKNIRYVFSDEKANHPTLKDAHILFNITFVPENYDDLLAKNQSIRAYIIVIDSKDVEEMEAILDENRAKLKSREVTISHLLLPIRQKLLWYEESVFRLHNKN